MELGESYRRLRRKIEDPKKTGILSADQQSKLTRTPGVSSRLNLHPQSKHGLELGPLPDVVGKQLGLHLGPPTTGEGVLPEPATCLPVDPTSLNRQPCLASLGEDTPSPW